MSVKPGGSNPFEILGVKPSATEEEIRQAWLKRVKRAHPDVTGDTGLKRTQELNTAYRELQDEQRRNYWAQSLLLPKGRVVHQVPPIRERRDFKAEILSLKAKQRRLSLLVLPIFTLGVFYCFYGGFSLSPEHLLYNGVVGLVVVGIFYLFPQYTVPRDISLVLWVVAIFSPLVPIVAGLISLLSRYSINAIVLYALKASSNSVRA